MSLVNYIKKTWKDAPSTDTPVNAENLNHIENGIYNNSTAVNTLDDNLTASDNLKFKFKKSGSKYGYLDSNGNFVPFDKVQASKTVTAGTSNKTVTPDSGYSGIASVTVAPTPSQSKTITSSRSAQTVTPDSGKLLSSVTVNKYPDASGTYNATSRGSALDMGAGNNLRYVNTNGVPNTNSGTYNVTSNGTKDMGATNSNRYVYVNVPSGVTKILTGYGQTVSLGGSYDTKCVFIMRGGPCAIYNDSVVFNNNVNYEIVVFDSTIVNKKVHGMVSLGKSSSTDVSLDGTYNTQKILVSISFDEGQTQRGFTVYSDHVNIQNHNGGYPQDVPYDIIVFN